MKKPTRDDIETAIVNAYDDDGMVWVHVASGKILDLFDDEPEKDIPVICVGERTINELRSGRDVHLKDAVLIRASDLQQNEPEQPMIKPEDVGRCSHCGGYLPPKITEPQQSEWVRRFNGLFEAENRRTMLREPPCAFRLFIRTLLQELFDECIRNGMMWGDNIKRKWYLK